MKKHGAHRHQFRVSLVTLKAMTSDEAVNRRGGGASMRSVSEHTTVRLRRTNYNLATVLNQRTKPMPGEMR